MALTSYVDTDNAGAVSSQTAIDSGVATAPAIRPSVFTPVTGYVASTAATDYSVGSTPTVRPQNFEPPTDTIVLDPGLIVSG